MVRGKKFGIQNRKIDAFSLMWSEMLFFLTKILALALSLVMVYMMMMDYIPSWIPLTVLLVGNVAWLVIRKLNL
jgi:hypothetical protein